MQHRRLPGAMPDEDARRQELATAQLTATTLRLHLEPVAATDALMAMRNPAFYKAKALPAEALTRTRR